MAHDGAKTAQDDAKMAQDDAKTRKDDAKTGQDDAETGQDGACARIVPAGVTTAQSDLDDIDSVIIYICQALFAHLTYPQCFYVFDGSIPHLTCPFSGERYCLVLFSTCGFESAPGHDKQRVCAGKNITS